MNEKSVPAASEIQEHPDGTTEVHHSDTDTVMLARGRDLPELLLTDPRRALEIIVAPIDAAIEAHRRQKTALPENAEVSIPTMPEHARGLTVTVPEGFDARAVAARLMIPANGAHRSGNCVRADFDRSLFPAVWSVITALGLSEEHISFE